MMVKPALYEVLGVSLDATGEDIEKAYRKKIIELPSSGVLGWVVTFFELRYNLDYAYSILGNADLRKIYDTEPEKFDFITHVYLGH